MYQEVKICQNCQKEFVIEPEDFDFYQKIKVPAPTWCPECRLILKLWHRKCMCGGQNSVNGVYKNTIKHFHGNNLCPNEFLTTYTPDRPEIVYCERCYLQEVV